MADFIRKQQEDLIYYVSPQLSMYPGVKHGFFARAGGVSTGMYESLNFRFTGTDSRENIMENYRIAAAALGQVPEHILRTTQKHTDCICVVDRTQEFASVGDGVDALITAAPGVVLTGFYADCQLVMLYDHRKQVCAVVHAGWRGIVNGIVAKTIQRMTEVFDCNPVDMTAAVGPSICRSCFECDEDVPQLLREAYGDMVNDYMYLQGEKWHVDLKNVTYMLLLRSGVQSFNIDMCSKCTKCDLERQFWSHRRDGEDRGVQAGMITLCP